MNVLVPSSVTLSMLHMCRTPARAGKGKRRAESPGWINLYKNDPAHEELAMKTNRHTVNVPGQMEPLIKARTEDFRSLSGYFVALCFTDLLYLPKRPIARAFANASWQQQQLAIESIATIRKQGWKGVDLHLHFDAVTQVEKVAVKCLKPGNWLLDHMEEELAFMRGQDLRR
jgi:hypothetical protein